MTLKELSAEGAEAAAAVEAGCCFLGVLLLLPNLKSEKDMVLVSAFLYRLLIAKPGHSYLSGDDN